MSETTKGRFFWRELQCGDLERARAFYGELFGWTVADSDMPGYAIVSQGGQEIGGMMRMTDEMKGVPPNWMSYVHVDDVDAVAEAARAHGGAVAVEPRDIPNVARFTVLGDPDGAYLSAMDGEIPAGPERPPPGFFCWETLMTGDAARAKAFYGAVFGWTTMSGPGGVDVFAAGGAPIADLEPATGMPPHWGTHVVVDALPAARTRAETGGGRVVVPEVKVPDMGTIAIVADPFGATLGLFEPSAALRGTG